MHHNVSALRVSVIRLVRVHKASYLNVTVEYSVKRSLEFSRPKDFCRAERKTVDV